MTSSSVLFQLPRDVFLSNASLWLDRPFVYRYVKHLRTCANVFQVPRHSDRDPPILNRETKTCCIHIICIHGRLWVFFRTDTSMRKETWLHESFNLHRYRLVNLKISTFLQRFSNLLRKSIRSSKSIKLQLILQRHKTSRILQWITFSHKILSNHSLKHTLFVPTRKV